MKQQHKQGYRLNAIMILRALKIAVGQDFYTLRESQVDALHEAADEAKYQKPKNANGSRARYFHDKLQRHAALHV